MSQLKKKSVKQSFVHVSSGSKSSASPYELVCMKGVRNTSFVPAEPIKTKRNRNGVGYKKAFQPVEPGPKKNDQFFGLFVYRNDLLVEVPSFDGRTLKDPRLQMQEEMCPEIKQLLNEMHLGSEWDSVVIQDRPVLVFKIEIGDWKKALAALNKIKEYLANQNIPIIAMHLNWHDGDYEEVLLNTTEAYDRTEVLMKIYPRVDPGVAEEEEAALF